MSIIYDLGAKGGAGGAGKAYLSEAVSAYRPALEVVNSRHRDATPEQTSSSEAGAKGASSTHLNTGARSA